MPTYLEGVDAIILETFKRLDVQVTFGGDYGKLFIWSIHPDASSYSN
jgi:hypothetical protein